MSELKDILATHNRKEKIAGGFTKEHPYGVHKECGFTCPACAQKRLVEWLEARLVPHLCAEEGWLLTKEDWQTLRELGR